MNFGADPLVSVITPTYNHGRYIRECIESMLLQTYSNWELIVVDDGSSDDTVAHVKAINDPRVQLYAREHVGIERLAETFNFGLAQARGELVGILEGDDRWSRDKLSIQVPLFADPGITLSYGRYGVIGSHGELLMVPGLAGPNVEGSFDAFPALLEDSFIMPVTVLLRRSTLVEAGGFRQLPGHGHIDYATWLELSQRGAFHATNHVLAFWRRHATSATVRATAKPKNLDGPYMCRDLALSALAKRTHSTDQEYHRTRQRVIVSWNRVLGRRYWHSGRLLQSQRRWREAALFFGRGLALSSLSPGQRLGLLAGLAFSLLRLDLERPIRFIKGGSPFADL